MPFSPGKSGNPNGRPKGIRDRRTALRDLLEPHAAELVAKAVELALAGDSAALRLCLERPAHGDHRSLHRTRAPAFPLPAGTATQWLDAPTPIPAA